jgi:hypothetical protein
MAVVQGIRERVHLPLFDSVHVEPKKQLRDEEASSILKFFINVQNKTKLETNLQSASLLPHYNTFEARAMRVVISDLPPEFPSADDRDASNTTTEDEEVAVTDEDGNAMDSAGVVEGETGFDPNLAVNADVELPLDRLVELLREAEKSDDGYANLPVEDDEVTRLYTGAAPGTDLTQAEEDTVIGAGAVVQYSRSQLRRFIQELDERRRPLKEQIDRGNGSGTIIGKFIYNTVTTLYVGEKIMIQVPTFFLPGGAGPYSEGGRVTTHGEPSPLATFRFAEPIFIDRQQNFRVEIEIPDADVLKQLQRIYGPFQIWVFLDGYMTRGVQ